MAERSVVDARDLRALRIAHRQRDVDRAATEPHRLDFAHEARASLQFDDVDIGLLAADLAADDARRRDLHRRVVLARLDDLAQLADEQ